MQSKLNYRRTFLVGLAFLSISAFWTMYDNIIPLMLQNTFQLGETVTGVLMAMDNVLALFLLPVFGALSDKIETPLGKRTPFILVGTILAVIFMTLLPLADVKQSLVLFIVALFATLLSMGLYRSPAVALMPDLTPNHLRSKANAVINLMGAVGGVYALVMIKLLVGPGDRPDYMPLFVSVMAVMVIAVGVLLLTVRENKLRKEIEAMERTAFSDGAAGKEEEQSASELPKEVKRSMLFMLLSVAFWYMAYNAVTTAFSRYTKVVWKMEGGGFADCLMIATVAAIISFIPIGEISAKLGRKKTVLGGVILMGVLCAAWVYRGISSARQRCVCADRYRLVGNQCQFLPDDCSDGAGGRYRKIYGNLLYLFHGGTGRNTRSVGLPSGKCVIQDAVSVCLCLYGACASYHDTGKARRCKAGEKGKSAGAF